MNNLAQWNKAGQRYPEIDSAIEVFERGLRERFPAPSEVQESLISSAAALHYAILLTRHKLSAPNARVKRIGPLFIQLPVLVGSQLRCLRALGCIGAEADAEPAGAAETLEQHIAKRNAAKAAEQL